MNTIAGETRTQQARCRQTAPGRLLNIAIPARCIAETTVSAEISVMAVGSHRIEISRSLPPGGHDCSPPLVADCRNFEKIEQLERHIGLQQRVRLAFLEHATPQIGEPLLLKRRCCERGAELLFSQHAPPVARMRGSSTYRVVRRLQATSAGMDRREGKCAEYVWSPTSREVPDSPNRTPRRPAGAIRRRRPLHRSGERLNLAM